MPGASGLPRVLAEIGHSMVLGHFENQ
jgi:hypothetical protein